MNISLDALVNSFLNFYAQNKHDQKLAHVTEFLLDQCLSARGYNNFRNKEESGENFFLREILAKTDPQLCIDIGANTGTYSLEILENTNSDIIAFEPLEPAFAALENNLSQYKTRVTLEQFGVGANDEELTINYNPDATSHASFSKEVGEIPYLDNHETSRVQVVSLDSYVMKKNIRKVDLIKIDVEGFESEVFDGASSVLKIIRPKFIQIEFNWHQLFRNKTLNYFAEKLPEYQCYQLLPGAWARRNPRDPHCNIFSFSNFVFALEAKR